MPFGRVLTPANVWLVAVLAVAAGAVVAAVAAGALALTSASEVADTDLVSEDVSVAAARLASTGASAVDGELRHIRNALDVEAVSVVAPDGQVMRSTAGSLVQTFIGKGSVDALTRDEASAIAIESPTRIDVDGVVEWMPGSPIVQVVAPLGDGNGVMLSYDPTSIDLRRAAANEPSPLVVPLTMFAVLFALTGVMLETARREIASARRHRAEAEESEAAMAGEIDQVRADLETERSRNQLRSRSTVAIIHEQRTLLTGVLTGAALISNSVHLDLSERDILEDVIADAARLETLGDQLLVASGVDAGLQVRIRRQPLSGVVDRLRRTDERAHVSMTQSLGMGPIDVDTDTTMLAQVVASLVDNSHAHGAQRVEIVVTDSIPGTIHHQIGGRPQSAIYIAVVDDGPGIDHGFLPKAFEAFASGRGSRGKGMGLYLVRMMVEAIGASLSVITSPKGTVMALAVPARAGQQAA